MKTMKGLWTYPGTYTQPCSFIVLKYNADRKLPRFGWQIAVEFFADSAEKYQKALEEAANVAETLGEMGIRTRVVKTVLDIIP